MPTRSVVFIYDHFYPDFTAGGPITSLGNLSALIKNDVPVSVITSAYRFEKKELMNEILPDQWTTWKNLPVWYASNPDSVKKAMAGFADGLNTVIYLNGVFSLPFFLTPLRLARKKKNKVIISPRGMLQAGALQKGRIKKYAYLFLVRSMGLLNKVTWHATDLRESQDIIKLTGRKIKLQLITNVPVVRQRADDFIEKKKGELRLVYYSLVAEKKNLLFLINVLNYPELQNVHLDIIGPIKDESYWRQCLEGIKTLANPGRVVYKGEVQPEESLTILQQYHALALPTKGENFGHAIIEMLAASRPVVISDKTPWKDLAFNNGGYSLVLNQDMWKVVLIKMLEWNDDEFQTTCKASFNYYRQKFDFERMKKEYIRLFTPSPKA